MTQKPPRSAWHPAWLKEVLGNILPLDEGVGAQVQARLDALAKPPGSLGRLEEAALQYAMIRCQPQPQLGKKRVYVFAADHGVVAEGVTAYPPEVTAQMVYTFLEGRAAINVLARHVGAEVKVVDIGVAHDFKGLKGLIHKKVMPGTRNFAEGPAMTRQEALVAMEEGANLALEAAAEGADILGTGDMGIGNTTPSTAIAGVMTGRPIADLAGKGAGLDGRGVRQKIKVIERAIELNHPDPKDPLDVLAKVGGLEIAAIAGFVLGAASRRVPAVVDGFISTSGALIAAALHPLIRDHLFISHLSAEKGHKAVCAAAGWRPLLDLDLRLGEGTGACLGISLVDASVKLFNEMATLEEIRTSSRH